MERANDTRRSDDSRMQTARGTNRRTVLKTIGVGVVGSVAVPGTAVAAPEGSRGRGRGPRSVLEIVGTHDHDTGGHGFDLSEEEIPSGWTTVVFDNQTDHTHFVYLVRVPDAEERLATYEGETLLEQYRNAVSLPFQEAWDPYFAGESTVGEFFGALFEALPPWFFGGVVPSGGVGLTAGGKTAMTTMDLEAGTYFAECYVLGEAGVFHTTTGMLGQFEAAERSSRMAEPEPTLEVSVSTDGIEFDGDDVGPGRHTVGIAFEDNQAYGHGLGHDVHLVRLDAGTSTDDVNEWMDYLDVGGDGFYADRGALTSHHHAVGPETFLGGVQDIFAGLPVTAYSHVTLKPGDYAWVAEVPDPMGNDMLSEFTVTPPGR